MKKGKKEIILKGLKIFFISLLSIILLFNIYIMIQAKSSPNKVPNIFGSIEPDITTNATQGGINNNAGAKDGNISQT